MAANHRRVAFAPIALGLLVLVAAVVTGGPRAAAIELTPERTILVVSANLREGHPFNPDDIRPRYGDLQRLHEMRNFARRLKNKLNRVPDVLLLQEVLEKSSTAVARSLSNRFDVPFRSIVHSERFYPKGGGTNPLIVRETAIVINERTMDHTSHRGYVHTVQRRSDPPAGAKPVSKGQAYALLREATSGAKFAVMSVHLMTRDAFASYDVAKVRREQWTTNLVNFMENGFPNADAHVIAGDFNEMRCVEYPESIDCTINPFWNTLVNSRSYTDTVFAKNSSSDHDIASQTAKRIDFIFTDGVTEKASHDVGYDRHSGDKGFISDHPFVRARLSAPVTP